MAEKLQSVKPDQWNHEDPEVVEVMVVEIEVGVVTEEEEVVVEVMAVVVDTEVADEEEVVADMVVDTEEEAVEVADLTTAEDAIGNVLKIIN